MKHFEMVSRTKKNWLEIFITPLAIAFIGSLATFFITNTQIKSAEKIASAEAQASEERAASDRQIKLLEIYSTKITSTNFKERQMAVKLLRLLDPYLASNLARVVLEDTTENSLIKSEANSILETMNNNYFIVVESSRTLEGAIQEARKLQEKTSIYPIHVYLAQNNMYAITLGGYLDSAEANRRFDYVRISKITSSAYRKRTTHWGENLFQ